MKKPAKLSKGSFIDLGDEPMEMPSAKSKPRKYYPSIRIKKKAFKSNIGKVGTALVKYKVRGIELRDGEPPETNIELQGFKEKG